MCIKVFENKVYQILTGEAKFIYMRNKKTIMKEKKVI